MYALLTTYVVFIAMGNSKTTLSFLYARVPHKLSPVCALRLQSNSGSLLVPPLGGEERSAELGPLLPHSILLEGNSWKESSVDIAIAGAALCWLACCSCCALQTDTQHACSRVCLLSVDSCLV